MSDKPFDCGTLFSPQKGKCFDINGEVFVCGEVVSPTADGIVKGKIYSSNDFTATETSRLDQTNGSHMEPHWASSTPSNLPNISLLNSLSDDYQSPGTVDKYKVLSDAKKEQKDSKLKGGSSIFKHFNCSVALLQTMTQTSNLSCSTNSNMCPQCEEQTLVVNNKPFTMFPSLPPFCTTCKAYFVNDDDNPKDLETLRDALMGDDGPSSMLDCRPSKGKIVMLSSKKEESLIEVPQKHSVEQGSMSSTAQECQDDYLSRQIIISPSSGSVSEDLTVSERTVQNNGLPEMVHPITYDGYDEDSIISFQSDLLSVYSEEEEKLLHQDAELVHTIASKEISKYSAENCKMTSNCERCSMPRMEINGIAKCVTCPKLLLKAQQHAHTRRLCAREKLVTMNFVPHDPQPSIAKRPMVFDFGFIPTNSTSDSDKVNIPVSLNGCSASETNSTTNVSINGWSTLETNSINPTSINGWSALGTNSFDDDNKLIQDSIGTHSEISPYSAGQSLTVSIKNETSNTSKGRDNANNRDMIVMQSIEDDSLAGEINGIKETDTEVDQIIPIKLDQEIAILIEKENYVERIVDDADKSNSFVVARDCCTELIVRTSDPGGVEEMNDRKEMVNLGHDPFEVSDEVSFGAPIGTLENTYDEKQGDIDLKQHEIGECATTRTIQQNDKNDGVSATDTKKICMYRNDTKTIQMEEDSQQVSSSKDAKIDREIDKRDEKFEEFLCEASSKRFEHQMNAYANLSKSPRRILGISSDMSTGGGSQDFATPRTNNLESGHTPLRMCEWENNSNARASEPSAIAYGSDQLTNQNKEQVQQWDQSFVGAHNKEFRLSKVNTQVPNTIQPISTFSPSKFIVNPGDPRTTLFIEGSANPDFSKGYPYARYRSEETPEGSIECLLQEHRCDLKDIASIFRKRDNSATSYCPSISKGSIEDPFLDLLSVNSQTSNIKSNDEMSRVLANKKRHASRPVPPILDSINFDSLRNSELVKMIPFSPIVAAKRDARESRLLRDHTRSNLTHPQRLDTTDVHTRRNFRFDDSILEAMPHNSSAFEYIPAPTLFSKTCNSILVKSASPLRQSANQPSQIIPSQIITNFSSNDSSRGDMLYFDDGRNHHAFNDCNDYSEEISETNSFAMDLFSMMEDYRKSQKSRNENDKLSFRQIPMGDSDIKSDFYTISTSTTSTSASTFGSQDFTLGIKQIESVESRVDVERLSYLMQRLGQVAKEIESLDETIEREERFADDQSLV